MCCSNIYGVRGFHVYKSVFLGWVVGRINIAVNGEHNCGVLPNNDIFHHLHVKEHVFLSNNKNDIVEDYLF